MEWWEGRSLPFTWSQQESSLLSIILVVSFLSSWGSFLLFLVYLQFISWMGAESADAFSTAIDLFCSVQFSHSVLSDSATPWTAACQVSLSITNSWSPPKHMSIKSVMPSKHLILCHPLLLLSIFTSIRVFSNESALRIRWPKYWSFSFNISPSNEHPGLIFSRMDWLDRLAVQGTLKSLL